MADREIERLITLLDEAYAGPAWPLPSWRSAGSDKRAGRMASRARAAQHLGNYSTRGVLEVRRATPLAWREAGSFGETGSNWFERPSAASMGSELLQVKAWKRDLAVLGRAQQELGEAVTQSDRAALDRRSAGSHHTPRRMIAGIAMHDAYHAGQIQLLKRLMAP